MSGLGSRPSEDHTAQHFLQGTRTEGEDYCFDPGLHSLQGELGDLWLIFVKRVALLNQSGKKMAHTGSSPVMLKVM